MTESKSVVACAPPLRESFHAVLLRPDDRLFDATNAAPAGRQSASYAAWHLFDIPSPETLAMIAVAIGLVGIRLFKKSRF